MRVEQVRQAAIALLEQAGVLTAGQRLWLRTRKLMASAELSLLGALPLLRHAPGLLLSCYGVCMAVTAPFKVPASRTFQCAICSKTYTLHSTQPPPPCCGGALLEVETARVMVPVRRACRLCASPHLPHLPKPRHSIEPVQHPHPTSAFPSLKPLAPASPGVSPALPGPGGALEQCRTEAAWLHGATPGACHPGPSPGR